MTTRYKVWSGLAVGLAMFLWPGLVSPLAVGSLFFLAFMLVSLSVLFAVLVVARTPALFWSAAVPALALMLTSYGALRFGSDAQTGIAILFVPLYAVAAALTGVTIYVVANWFTRRPTVGITV